MPGVVLGTVPKEPQWEQIYRYSVPIDKLLPLARDAGGTGVDEVREVGTGASRKA